jgi:hypothetical protein
MLLIISSLVAVAGGIADTGATNLRIPPHCGTFRLYGWLHRNQVVLWDRSSSARPITIEGRCDRCPYFVDLPVEVVARFSEMASKAEIREIRAQMDRPSLFNGRGAVKSLTTEPCAQPPRAPEKPKPR